MAQLVQRWLSVPPLGRFDSLPIKPWLYISVPLLVTVRRRLSRPGHPRVCGRKNKNPAGPPDDLSLGRRQLWIYSNIKIIIRWRL